MRYTSTCDLQVKFKDALIFIVIKNNTLRHTQRICCFYVSFNSLLFFPSACHVIYMVFFHPGAFLGWIFYNWDRIFYTVKKLTSAFILICPLTGRSLSLWTAINQVHHSRWLLCISLLLTIKPVAAWHISDLSFFPVIYL